MLHNNIDILDKSILYSSESSNSYDLSSIISYPLNNEEFIRNTLEYIEKTNIITKDTHEINFTENNEYKDFHIELNEEKEKEKEKNVGTIEIGEEKSITNIEDCYSTVNKEKKRGRNRCLKRKYKRKTHTRNAHDNILCKLQVHFMKFLINISNDVIRQVLKKGKKLSFVHLDYLIKKNINFTFFENLKSKQIKEVLQMPISSKYKTKIKEYNKMIYNKVLALNKESNQSNLLNEFFEMKYANLFKIYYNNAEALNNLYFNGECITCSIKTKSFYYLIQSYLDLKDEIMKVCRDFYFNNDELTDNISSNNNYFRVMKI